MNNRRRIVKIIKREWIRISERKNLYAISIALPVILFLIYAGIYQNEVVRELPVSIYDADNSQYSRKVIQMIESSSSMKIVDYSTSISEIKEKIISGEIEGAFYIADNFERDIKRGKPTNLIVYKNNANLIIGNVLLKEGMTISKTFSGGVLMGKLEKKGMNSDQAYAIVSPIKMVTHSLYNPNYSYLSYLAPGLMTYTIQMIIMVCAVLLISTEFKENTFGELVELAGGKIGNIILGKFIPHSLLHLTTAILIIGVLFPLFGIKLYGSVLLLMLLFIFYIAASLMMGLMISSFVHDHLFATEIALFINTPGFIFSGFTFPIWGMPFAHTIFAQVIPFTHFLSGFLKIYQMNLGLSDIMNEIGILTIFIVACLILTAVGLKFGMKNYKYSDGYALPEGVK